MNLLNTGMATNTREKVQTLAENIKILLVYYYNSYIYL